MTCSIITPGHIDCLKYLLERGEVVLGILNSKALQGYKAEFVPFKDRKYVLETLCRGIGEIQIVEQSSLNPIQNVLKFRCNAIASGDGFEKEEMEAIKRARLIKIDVRLLGEKKKRYSSTKILNK